MVKLILEERTLKIKEGMKMMGVTEGAVWLSWFFSYVIVYFIISWILALLLKINIYRYSGVGKDSRLSFANLSSFNRIHLLVLFRIFSFHHHSGILVHHDFQEHPNSDSVCCKLCCF
jgi:4-amino-4-deoxy-L-arabinose transferase-like glycosyltransferase